MNASGRPIPYFRGSRALQVLVAIVCIHIIPTPKEASAYHGTTFGPTGPSSEIQRESIFAGSPKVSQQSDQLSKNPERISMKASERPESSSERWILTQVNAGEDADLKKRFPDEADRMVDSIFIRRLLTGHYSQEVKVHPYGVHIANAKIYSRLDLSNEEIPYDVSFTDCIFQDEVKLNGAKFTGTLNFDRSTFNNKVDFRELVLTTNLFLQKTVFNGPAGFYGISIGGNLAADDVQFNEIQEEVNFEKMKIGGYVFLRRAVFKGPARFYRASVNDNFESDDATFGERARLTSFQNMRINGHALFHRTIFAGPVSFNSTVIGGAFETGDDRGGAQFKGSADFSSVTAGAVGFPHTNFSGQMLLRGIKYQRMSSGIPRNLLVMLNLSAYDSGAYAQLEQYCRDTGDLDQADEVYIQKRRRERSQLSMTSKFGNLMLDWLVGYGRRPWRTLFWSALIVFGAALFVFRRKDMQAKDPKDEPRPYNAFLYSLDLLLPIVDLQAASTWRPKPESRRARRYLPIHVIAGWILGSVLAAALSGLLK